MTRLPSAPQKIETLARATGALDSAHLENAHDLHEAAENLVDAIVDAVAQLTPSQRRQLQRQLHATGLFGAETLLTDQQRLLSAPALGDALLQRRTAATAGDPQPSIPAKGRSSFVEPQPPAPIKRTTQSGRRSTSSTSSTTANAEDASVVSHPSAAESLLSAIPPATIAPAPVEKRPYDLTNPNRAKKSAPYRSPISGKVVVGTPEHVEAQAPDPHLMPPLPGQAPERPLILVVERGSYMLRWPSESPQRVRLTFKEHVTEQEALYDTLIAVLETVEQRLRDTKADPATARLDIRSADRLFVQQVRGEIPCEDHSLQMRRTHALKKLKRFAEARLSYQG